MRLRRPRLTCASLVVDSSRRATQQVGGVFGIRADGSWAQCYLVFGGLMHESDK